MPRLRKREAHGATANGYLFWGGGIGKKKKKENQIGLEGL